MRSCLINGYNCFLPCLFVEDLCPCAVSSLVMYQDYVDGSGLCQDSRTPSSFHGSIVVLIGLRSGTYFRENNFTSIFRISLREIKINEGIFLEQILH